MNHGLDEFSDDMDSGPVSTMHDDIAFAFVLGKFLSVIVLDVAFANGRYFRGQGLFVGVLYVKGVVLLDHV